MRIALRGNERKMSIKLMEYTLIQLRHNSAIRSRTRHPSLIILIISRNPLSFFLSLFLSPKSPRNAQLRKRAQKAIHNANQIIIWLLDAVTPVLQLRIYTFLIFTRFFTSLGQFVPLPLYPSPLRGRYLSLILDWPISGAEREREIERRRKNLPPSETSFPARAVQRGGKEREEQRDQHRCCCCCLDSSPRPGAEQLPLVSFPPIRGMKSPS